MQLDLEKSGVAVAGRGSLLVADGPAVCVGVIVGLGVAGAPGSCGAACVETGLVGVHVGGKTGVSTMNSSVGAGSTADGAEQPAMTRESPISAMLHGFILIHPPHENQTMSSQLRFVLLPYAPIFQFQHMTKSEAIQ